MVNREKINELVEPGKPGTLSEAYDLLILLAIAMGSVSLLFREYRPMFWYLDIISGVIYIADYLLRWATCDLRSEKPKWKAFLLYPFTPMAILDLLSIMPTFEFVSSTYRLANSARLLKLFRFIKVVNYIGPIATFVKVIKRQWKPLLAVVLVALFDIFVTAIIMFQSEQEIDPVTGEYIFKNFFDAFYWATITLTTVGYGDLAPVSDLGRTLSMISSLIGIGVIAMPSGIITAGYMQEINRRMKDPKEQQTTQETNN